MREDLEFQTLREELREWQGRRFSILSISSVFIVAYISWVANKPETWNWDVASIPILLISIGSCLLTRHFSMLVVRVSTYLEVFHDFKWQNRLSFFRESIGPLKTNQLIAVYYLGTVLTSCLAFFSICEHSKSLHTIIIFSVVSLIFIVCLVAMAFYSFPNAKYLNAWHSAKSKENI